MDVLQRSIVASLYREGWTCEEIAEETGVALEDIIQYCNKLI